MATTLETKDLRGRMQRLESLIQEVEGYADPAAQAHAREMVRALLDLHGAALTTILERLTAAGEPGQAMLTALAQDDLVGSLLVLYELHPLDLETRVRQALESVRPYLRSHGGNVELLGIEDGAVRLRLEGSCHSCPSSAQTLKQSIEEAIYAKAPDVTALTVEGVTEPPAARPAAAFVPVEQLQVRNGRAH